MWVDALALLILIGVTWAVSSEGLIGSSLMLINVTLAGLLAMNFFQPLADWLTGMIPAGVYWWDLVCLTVLFSVVLLLLRLTTEALAPVQVRFPPPLPHLRWLFGLWTGWLVTCFLMTALQTAPMPRNILGYGPERQHFLGIALLPAPERAWLAFFQRTTESVFDRSAPPEDPQRHVFDPNGLFLPSYAQQRENFQRGIEPTDDQIIRAP